MATADIDQFPLTDVIPRAANSSLPAALRIRFAPSGAISLSSGRSIVTIGNANQGETAMTDLVNFIRFNDNNTLTGNIASVAYDLDIFGEEFDSANAKAATTSPSRSAPATAGSTSTSAATSDSTTMT